MNKHRISTLTFMLLALFPLATLATTQAEVDAYLSGKGSTPEIAKEWVLLKSIGWQTQVSKTDSATVEIKAGEPLKLESFDQLPFKTCTVLCLQIGKSIELKSQTLTKALDAAIESKASAEAFRLKLSSNARKSALEIGGSFSWPQDDVDALGTGFDGKFKRREITLKELEQAGAIEKGEYDKVEDAIPADELSNYASWSLAKGVKPSAAIDSLVKGSHTSGCQIALGSLVHRLIRSVYNLPAIFDGFFKDVLINNAFFRKSTILPELKYDNSGVQKARKGSHFLVGEAGYIESVFSEKVENPDYAGENILFTEVSKTAIDDLIQLKGFGHNPLSEEDLEDYDEEDLKGNANDPRLTGFTGLSGEMVQFWLKFKDLKKATKKSAEALADDLKSGALSSGDTKAKGLFKAALKILDRPAFTEVTVWGHPYGEQSLKDWIITLAAYNPNTPYGIFIYDYGLATTQWENYKQAHLK